MRTDQRGFVLPMALLLMIIVGFLAVYSLRDSGIQERQSAVSAMSSRAFERAEAQLMQVEAQLMQTSRSITDADFDFISEGRCDANGEVIDAGFGYEGFVVFSEPESCEAQNWFRWLQNNCRVEPDFDALGIDLPDGWSICVAVWQADMIVQDELEAQGVATIPVWRYITTVMVEAPQAQGGSRVAIQSLLNAEER